MKKTVSELTREKKNLNKRKEKKIYYHRDMEFCDSSIYFRKQFKIKSLGKRPL